MTLAEDLADWGTGLRMADIPDRVQATACRHLLDGIGTALAARRSGVVDAAAEVARSMGGPAEAALLGERSLIGAPAAAFGTGALVHGLDFDDTHAGGLVHATAAVLPTALAVGQQISASGEQVLTAAIAGYETVCRIAMGTPHGFHARGMHATGVAGVFAAAMVAARLMRLSAATTTQALGIAGSSSAGLLEFLSTGASTKQLHPGSAALNGIIAARLAAAGATGPTTVLEGPHGVYAALSARPADLDVVTAGLGADWELDKIAIKPYPACQLMHVTLDALAAARAQRAMAPAEIVEVVAHVHPDSASVVCEPAESKIRPRTSYDAKFSLPWTAAALLYDDGVTVETFAGPSIARDAVAELAQRVHTRVTATDGPAADAPGHVEVRLTDGHTVIGEVAGSLGGPTAPLSRAALVEKFTANAGGGDAVAELAELTMGLANQPDLSTIVDAAARAAQDAKELA